MIITIGKCAVHSIESKKVLLRVLNVPFDVIDCSLNIAFHNISSFLFLRLCLTCGTLALSTSIPYRTGTVGIASFSHTATSVHTIPSHIANAYKMKNESKIQMK